MKHYFLILAGIFLFNICLVAQIEKPNILVTGFWNPTGQMISHFSNDAELNPTGWEGENWMGLGFNIHSFFPEPSVYTGIFEVDYQNVQQDLNYLTDSLKPIAIISFGAGTGPWEIEAGARNLNLWNPDDNAPLYPTPNPPDSTLGVLYPRYSSLPLEEIKNSVNDETTVLARIDESNDLGAYICEYTAFLDAWYHDLNNSDTLLHPCLKTGFIHVRNNLSLSEVTKAANITVRETANALLKEIMNVSGNVTFEDTTQSPIGTRVKFIGEQSYELTINNENGKYTIPYIRPGNYQLKVNLNDKYVFDSLDVVIDSIQQIDINFGFKVDINNKIVNNIELLQNYPNPFVESTKIGFNINTKSKVTLKIFDLSGRVINVLADQEFGAGYHSLVWNGNHENGQKVNSGVYIYQLENNGIKYYRQCVFIK